MHRRQSPFVLPLLLSLPMLLPTARTASAAPPEAKATESDAAAVVEKKLVEPLAQKEEGRTRFSRAYVPPLGRRVRIHDGERATDAHGAAFVAFSVDERVRVFTSTGASNRWRTDAILGCVYPERDEVFIRRGDKFFAAGLLLGHKTPSADEAVCRQGSK